MEINSIVATYKIFLSYNHKSKFVMYSHRSGEYSRWTRRALMDNGIIKI